MADENKKLTSRKFFIVLVWLVILAVVFVLAFCGKATETIIDKVLGYFFGVCMLYLGVNVTQKGIQAYLENKDNE